MTIATTARAGRRQPVTLATGSLEIVFEWSGDRWRHRIAHHGLPIAESVEGPEPDGDPRWPPGPAFQEVTPADAATGRVVLAVGAAGRSHFSASFAADPGVPDTVLVDVACRIQEGPGWLGTTYRLGSGAVVRVAAAGGPPPRTVRWSYRVGPRGVFPAAGEMAAPAPTE